MNFSYTTNPSYVDLVSGMYKAMRWHYRADNWDGYTFPNGFFKGKCNKNIFVRKETRPQMICFYIL